MNKIKPRQLICWSFKILKIRLWCACKLQQPFRTEMFKTVASLYDSRHFFMQNRFSVEPSIDEKSVSEVRDEEVASTTVQLIAWRTAVQQKLCIWTCFYAKSPFEITNFLYYSLRYLDIWEIQLCVYNAATQSALKAPARAINVCCELEANKKSCWRCWLAGDNVCVSWQDMHSLFRLHTQGRQKVSFGAHLWLVKISYFTCRDQNSFWLMVDSHANRNTLNKFSRVPAMLCNCMHYSAYRSIIW